MTTDHPLAGRARKLLDDKWSAFVGGHSTVTYSKDQADDIAISAMLALVDEVREGKLEQLVASSNLFVTDRLRLKATSAVMGTPDWRPDHDMLNVEVAACIADAVLNTILPLIEARKQSDGKAPVSKQPITDVHAFVAALDTKPLTHADLDARMVPVPMLLHCPVCNARHVDVGEFSTKLHHTHACQNCGHVWRPAIVPTTGVQFLPGFKDAIERAGGR